MIKNLSEYFLPRYEFFLEKVSYEKLEKNSERGEYSLNCHENIIANHEGNNSVHLTVTRTLKFEPEEMFSLTVSYGAVLTFRAERKNEYDWSEIKLAEEFRNNGDFVVNNLVSRISLLVAQITSSYGQAPLILPPNLMNRKKE